DQDFNMKPSLALNPNWEIVDNDNPTLMRKGRSANNSLQISVVWNEEARDLGASNDLEALACAWVESLGGRSIQQSRGACTYGEFFSSIFSAKNLPYCQLWCISNNVHFIFATFICEGPPTPEEIREVERMALSLTLPDHVDRVGSVH